MPDVEGYGTCRCGCGGLELNHVLWLTAGLRWECFRDGKLDKLHRAAVNYEGQLIHVDLAPPAKTKRKRKTNATESRRLAHQARQAAQKRLAKMHPELYDVLYADERHKRKLPIVPKRVPQGHFDAVVTTNTERLVYPAPDGNAQGSP